MLWSIIVAMIILGIMWFVVWFIKNIWKILGLALICWIVVMLVASVAVHASYDNEEWYSDYQMCVDAGLLEADVLGEPYKHATLNGIHRYVPVINGNKYEEMSDREVNAIEAIKSLVYELEIIPVSYADDDMTAIAKAFGIYPCRWYISSIDAATLALRLSRCQKDWLSIYNALNCDGELMNPNTWAAALSAQPRWVIGGMIALGYDCDFSTRNLERVARELGIPAINGYTTHKGKLVLAANSVQCLYHEIGHVVHNHLTHNDDILTEYDCELNSNGIRMFNQNEYFAEAYATACEMSFYRTSAALLQTRPVTRAYMMFLLNSTTRP